MKKIMLIIVLLLTTLPVQGAFAQSGGLLNGKLMNTIHTYTGEQSTTTKLTDNSDETSLPLSRSRLSTAYFINVSFIFDSPVVVSGIYLSFTNVANDSSFKATFYDEHDNVVLTKYGVAGLSQINPISVKKVILAADVDAVILKEFDLFASAAATPTPTPKPTATPTPTLSLLSGKAINVGMSRTDASGGSTYSLTDGNSSTYYNFGGWQNNYNMDTGWYQFSTPVNIESYFVYSLSGNPKLQFYNSSDGLIDTVSTIVKNGTKTNFSAVGVSKVVISNGHSTDTLSLADFDVFSVAVPTATPTATPTPIPSNTDSSKFIINNLNYSVESPNAITLQWSPIDSIYLKHYKVYQDNELVSTVTTNSFSMSNLVPGTHVYKVVPVDTFNKDFNGATLSYVVPIPDVTPPAVPTNIKITPDRYTAAVTWDKPNDPDLLGYYLYLDDARVNASPELNNSFNLIGLTPNKEYKVQVVSVDMTGNLSAKSSPVNFKTLTLQTAPSTPGNFAGYAFYKGAALSWLPASSAQSYIVYMDGVELFQTAQTNTKVSNLENGTEYQFQVSAVNEIGESDLSSTVTILPKADSAVDVSLGYSLKDLSDGTASMFSAQWLLLAFCIAIPLSFYISNRIKGLIND